MAAVAGVGCLLQEGLEFGKTNEMSHVIRR